ncbi:M20/M25/M40 family metallo-hydrolase [Aestuariibius sp. 2305UL40-4]|uniref:M20/M25/M40 family metallo-hydrolase n=1 Tax=Aestuariibius violaceus TaxID=3234132 RepID=UPI00345F0327
MVFSDPSFPAPTAERARTLRGQVSAARLRADTEALLGPQDRQHFPDRMSETEAGIAARLSEAGLEPEIRPFAVGSAGPAVRHRELKGANVVAVKPGRRREAIVIGAHFDTVPGTPGADDNISSVAAMLEVARLVAGWDLEPTLIFVAFDMEEIGLHGARAFVREQLGDRPLTGAIIYESIAYTSAEPGSQKMPPGFGLLFPRVERAARARGYAGDWGAVLYREPAGRLARLYAASLDALQGEGRTLLLRDPCDFPIIGRMLERRVPFVRNFGRSDHVPFWEAGLPAIMVTDTADFRNPHYHQRSDLPATLDFDHLRDVVAATALMVECVSEAAVRGAGR